MPLKPPTHRPHGEGDRKAWDRAYDRKRLKDRRLAFAKHVRSSARWRNLRAVKLMRNPLCEECERQGVVRVAKEVHHIIPIRVNPHLAYVESNLEALCVPCHRKRDAEQERTK